MSTGNNYQNGIIDHYKGFINHLYSLNTVSAFGAGYHNSQGDINSENYNSAVDLFIKLKDTKSFIFQTKDASSPLQTRFTLNSSGNSFSEILTVDNTCDFNCLQVDGTNSLLSLDINTSQSISFVTINLTGTTEITNKVSVSDDAIFNCQNKPFNNNGTYNNVGQLSMTNTSGVLYLTGSNNFTADSDVVIDSTLTSTQPVTLAGTLENSQSYNVFFNCNFFVANLSALNGTFTNTNTVNNSNTTVLENIYFGDSDNGKVFVESSKPLFKHNDSSSNALLQNDSSYTELNGVYVKLNDTNFQVNTTNLTTSVPNCFDGRTNSFTLNSIANVESTLTVNCESTFSSHVDLSSSLSVSNQANLDNNVLSETDVISNGTKDVNNLSVNTSATIDKLTQNCNNFSFTFQSLFQNKTNGFATQWMYIHNQLNSNMDYTDSYILQTSLNGDYGFKTTGSGTNSIYYMESSVEFTTSSSAQFDSNIDVTNNLTLNNTFLENNAILELEGNCNVDFKFVSNDLVIQGYTTSLTLDENSLVLKHNSHFILQDDTSPKNIQFLNTLSVSNETYVNNHMTTNCKVFIGESNSFTFSNNSNITTFPVLQLNNTKLRTLDTSDNLNFCINDIPVLEITASGVESNCIFKLSGDISVSSTVTLSNSIQIYNSISTVLLKTNCNLSFINNFVINSFSQFDSSSPTFNCELHITSSTASNSFSNMNVETNVLFNSTKDIIVSYLFNSNSFVTNNFVNSNSMNVDSDITINDKFNINSDASMRHNDNDENVFHQNNTGNVIIKGDTINIDTNNTSAIDITSTSITNQLNTTTLSNLSIVNNSKLFATSTTVNHDINDLRINDETINNKNGTNQSFDQSSSGNTTIKDSNSILLNIGTTNKVKVISDKIVLTGDLHLDGTNSVKLISNSVFIETDYRNPNHVIQFSSANYDCDIRVHNSVGDNSINIFNCNLNITSSNCTVTFENCVTINDDLFIGFTGPNWNNNTDDFDSQSNSAGNSVTFIIANDNGTQFLQNNESTLVNIQTVNVEFHDNELVLANCFTSSDFANENNVGIFIFDNASDSDSFTFSLYNPNSWNPNCVNNGIWEAKGNDLFVNCNQKFIMHNGNSPWSLNIENDSHDFVIKYNDNTKLKIRRNDVI